MQKHTRNEINRSYQNSWAIVPYLRWGVDGACRRRPGMWRWQVGRAAPVGNRLNERGVLAMVRVMTLVCGRDRACPLKRRTASGTHVR